MKTKLERLLDGEKATFNGHEIIKVLDVSKNTRLHPTSQIVLIVNRAGFAEILVFSVASIESSDMIKFIEPETPKKRTIKDGVKVGDVLIIGNDKRRVLGICDEVIFLSLINILNKSSISSFTLIELIEMGYKLEGEQKKDKPEKIRYDVSEGYFVKTLLTECPYEMECEVGSYPCMSCCYFVKANSKKQWVKCNYKNKKDEK